MTLFAAVFSLLELPSGSDRFWGVALVSRRSSVWSCGSLRDGWPSSFVCGLLDRWIARETRLGSW